MLFGEKKKINFLIENELEGFCQFFPINTWFSAQEIEIIESAADRLKTKLKTINENLTKSQKEDYGFTYENMKEYFEVIMLDFYIDDLIKKGTAIIKTLDGYSRDKYQEILNKRRAEREDIRKKSIKYRGMIKGVLERIVEEKKSKI